MFLKYILANSNPEVDCNWCIQQKYIKYAALQIIITNNNCSVIHKPSDLSLGLGLKPLASALAW